MRGIVPTRAVRCVLGCVTALCVGVVTGSAAAQDTGAEVPPVHRTPDAPPAPPSAPAAEETEEPSQSGEEAEALAAEEAEIAAALAEDAPHCNGTGIEGVVRDAETRETLIEAPVIVVGRGTRTLTDYDGRFALDLPAGTYTLRSYYDLYEATRVENIRVTRGECAHVEIELAVTSSEGEEVVIEVRGESGSEGSALRLRRESATVQDSVSAEEIRRSPDSDAAEASRRIVGATIIGGQYLYVRGLGGRYTSVLLDGAYLPSSDPDQPGVQLDLFPSAILNGLTVQKTFTPDLPGDSAGGTMIISTRDYPSHFRFGVSLQIGANTETTFGQGIMGRSGGLDFLGYDDGTRALPSTVRDQPLLADGTQESVSRMRGFAPETWAVGQGLLGPNGRIGLHMGDTLMVGDRRFGYFLSLGYGTRTQRLLNETLTGIGFGGEPRMAMPVATTPRISTQTNTQLGGLGSFHLELSDDDELQVTILWTQTSDSYVGQLTGVDVENDQVTRYTRQRFIARNLYFGQLRGEHRGLPFHSRLRWALSASSSNRDEPDTRDTIYGANEGSDRYSFQDDPSSGLRLFSALGSLEAGGTLDLDIPIDVAHFRLGGAFRANERNFALRRFRSSLNPDQEVDTALLGLPPDQLFATQQLGMATIIQEQTNRTDGYFASQTLLAGYAMLDWQIVDWLRAIGGARIEGFRQTIDPRLPTSTTVDLRDAVYRTDVDVLGSAGLVFTLTDGMFVRLSYGTTVARPQIRELAEFPYPDFIRQRTLFGESSLRRTRIDSYDLRWEWFPGANEVLAVSGFVKNFESPIETVGFGNSTFTYRNIQGGLNVGGEVETRLSFGRLHEALRFFDLAANVTLVYSEARMSEAERASSTNLIRPLAGQSPYVINVSLGFTLDDPNLSLRIYYNVFGERLLEVGVMDSPDVYQQPFHSFDVTAAWEFATDVTLRASVENVFLDDYVLTQGPAIAQQYNAGLTASLGLAWEPE